MYINTHKLHYSLAAKKGSVLTNVTPNLTVAAIWCIATACCVYTPLTD